MFHPRKSNPVFSLSIWFKVWQILVLLSFNSSPRPCNQLDISSFACWMTDLSLWRTMKSSAYLISEIFVRFFRLSPFQVSAHCLMYSSSPCRAILANKGLMTPPCGVPSSVGNQSPLSNIPDLSHARTCRAIAGVVFSFCSRTSWLMRSKHLAISASNTYLDFWAIAICIATTASWQPEL